MIPTLSDEIISSLVVGTCTVAAVYITHRLQHPRKKEKSEVIKKQFYNVYLPLFKMMEPHLFKKPSKSFLDRFLNEFNTIKDEHYELIECNLLNNVKLLEEKYKKHDQVDFEIYESICTSLERHFERSRKRLSLPTRKWYYKVNNRQFKQQTWDTIEVTLKSLIHFLLWFLIFLVLMCIASILTPFIDTIRNLF